MTIPDCAAIGKVRRAVAETEEGSSPNRPVVKVTGSRHLGAALSYSLSGALRLLRETAFRHEIIAGAAILVVFAIVGAGLSDYVMMVILMLSLVAAEALNTAIEEIIDRISPEWSSTGQHAKDLGSFAVMCLLLANGLMAGFIVISRIIAV
ncbi:diacylglycerol kinase [Neorhizobium sp. NCHU2750]|uniref:diacylglycerol kinase n=1 Tax=Neorhizobium sp. NCHU2750 TaxID=1825976 RepID=UPI000E76A317|nr:diacylglycerol kinase [Neorhizobium sp. NCHU2750]